LLYKPYYNDYLPILNKLKEMRSKIIEIIGHGINPELAELRATEIIIEINEMLLNKAKRELRKGRTEGFKAVTSLFIDI